MLMLWLTVVLAISVCQEIRDADSSPTYSQCYKTNYKGPVSDFSSSPNGVKWNFQITNFGFDWPQTGVAFLPPSSLVRIDSISFTSADNLVYFRVVITQNNGSTITSQAIGPNDRSTTLSGANDVKRVDFYLASFDFRRNVSLNGVDLEVCTGNGSLRNCSIFSLVKDLIQAASPGIIRLCGKFGTFSASVVPEHPFIEFDLNCSGAGTVNFTEVIFHGPQNFSYVAIGVWDGKTAVPIVHKDGVASDLFSNAEDITFASGVRGNLIRSTIIPSKVPNQGISGSIRFSLYSIFGDAS